MAYIGKNPNQTGGTVNPSDILGTVTKEQLEGLFVALSTVGLTVVNGKVYYPDITVPVSITSVSSATVTEGGVLTHTVMLSRTTSEPTTFSYSKSNITTEVDDYIDTPSFNNGVQFNPGNTSLLVPANVSQFTISFTTINDIETETTESYLLTIGGVGAAGTINDNDSVAPSETVINNNENITVSDSTTLQLTYPIIFNGNGYLAFGSGSSVISN